MLNNIHGAIFHYCNCFYCLNFSSNLLTNFGDRRERLLLPTQRSISCTLTQHLHPTPATRPFRPTYPLPCPTPTPFAAPGVGRVQNIFTFLQSGRQIWDEIPIKRLSIERNWLMHVFSQFSPMKAAFYENFSPKVRNFVSFAARREPFLLVRHWLLCNLEFSSCKLRCCV